MKLCIKLGDYIRRDEGIMIDLKLTGQRMRELCRQRGITVKQIQKELGIGAFQSVYNWFNGKTLPPLDNFFYLSKMLNVSKESMLVDESVKSSKNYISKFCEERKDNLIISVDLIELAPIRLSVRMH